MEGGRALRAMQPLGCVQPGVRACVHTRERALDALWKRAVQAHDTFKRSGKSKFTVAQGVEDPRHWGRG